MYKYKSKQWEVEASSLRKINDGAITYEEAKRYSQEDIAGNLTKVDFKDKKFYYVPKNVDFHFLARVDTAKKEINKPSRYYDEFKERVSVSCCVLNNANVSRYGNGVLFAYNVLPEEILHVFPCDSDTRYYPEDEDSLTCIPSLWLTLKELEEESIELQTYSQVSIKTKRDGKIIKPFAVIAINSISYETRSIAESFCLPIIVIYPKDYAVNNVGDFLCKHAELQKASNILKEKYGFSIVSHMCIDE